MAPAVSRREASALDPSDDVNLNKNDDNNNYNIIIDLHAPWPCTENAHGVVASFFIDQMFDASIIGLLHSFSTQLSTVWSAPKVALLESKKGGKLPSQRRPGIQLSYNQTLIESIPSMIMFIKKK